LPITFRMDSTLAYSIAAGLGLVFLFLFAKFALRWFIRIVVVGIILAVLGGATWIWLNYSSSRPETKPRPTSTRSSGRQ